MSRPNKKQRQHFADLIDLGCIICLSPAEIHHIETSMGVCKNHDRVVPLCPRHHRGGEYGVSLDASKREFERIYGTEAELMERAEKLLKIKQAGQMSGCRTG